ncbi:hypothetical protein MP477_07780 [Chryseobacterium sp. WG23]|uniref:hypothetical protein n=1 Tax=Chryseobacterium sp. WG23 TaxID=2926910 RepID=UPI00211F27A6|nr:hypothetical protein [Chryseobacterium sp. WG23]MCQ9634847.1 hypothetical protein [Chryseobacterium sp. WG23]
MKKYILIFIVFSIIQSCSVWKNELTKNGDYEIAIKNAVIDFCNTSSLANKDKAFSVSYKEYKSGVIGVSILGDINKIYLVNDSFQGRIKDRYIEYNNHLFYWYDEKKGKDPNIINKLSEYNIIEKVDSLTEDTGYTIDDAKKATHYYFCRDNLLLYKKEASSVAMPKEVKKELHCSDK